MKNLFILPLATLLLSACASNSGVIKTGDNNYFISKQQATGFPGIGNLKAEVYQEANTHCSTIGGELETISYSENDGPFIAKYPKVSLEFKC